jgi:hypothetical protein
MNKLIWTTLVMGFFCYASSYAQPANDSTLAQHSLLMANDTSLFTHFNVSMQDLNKVLLQWMVPAKTGSDYFVVEHGKDSSHLETLGILKRSGNLQEFELIDNDPSIGTNYYRIKSIDTSGNISFSKTIQIGITGNTGFKFYPNPVDKFLIVETEQPVDIQVISTSGNFLISSQLQKGMQIVNVSSLQKGEYVLRVIYKHGNKVVLEHLLKN